MSSIDILSQKEHSIIVGTREGAMKMMSSLHVSLPDEMRHYVDYRTDGKKFFSTPSEYIRTLIREDMTKEAEKLYVYKALLQGMSEMNRREIVPESVLDIMNED